MLDVLSSQLDNMFANRGNQSPEPKSDQEETGENGDENDVEGQSQNTSIVNKSQVREIDDGKKEKFLAEMKQTCLAMTTNIKDLLDSGEMDTLKA